MGMLTPYFLKILPLSTPSNFDFGLFRLIRRFAKYCKENEAWKRKKHKMSIEPIDMKSRNWASFNRQELVWIIYPKSFLSRNRKFLMKSSKKNKKSIPISLCMFRPKFMKIKKFLLYDKSRPFKPICTALWQVNKQLWWRNQRLKVTGTLEPIDCLFGNLFKFEIQNFDSQIFPS